MPVKTLHKVLNKKARIPILNHIHVKSGVATATDMDMWYSTKVKKIKMGMYHCDGFKDGIYLASELPVVDFPEFGESKIKGKPLAVIKFDRDQIKVLEWVAKAQSTEETRYYLNGTYFDKHGFVATDGHRLHQAKYPAKFKKDIGDSGVIIPRKAIALFIAGMKESKASEGTVEIWKDGAVITFSNTVIKTKTVDGTYPDYHRVIPEVDGACADFSPKALAKHKKLVSAVLKESGECNGVEFGSRDGNMHFGKFKHKTSVDVHIVFPYAIGFNYRYVLQMNEGQIYFSDNKSPHVIKGIDKKTGIETLGVLMPMRIF